MAEFYFPLVNSEDDVPTTRHSSPLEVNSLHLTVVLEDLGITTLLLLPAAGSLRGGCWCSLLVLRL